MTQRSMQQLTPILARLRRVKLTEPQRKACAMFWQDGLDTYDIAREIGVHESTVYNARATEGVRLEQAGREEWQDCQKPIGTS